MNKAFVREPEDTGRHYCSRCGGLGLAVSAAVLDRFLTAAARTKLGDVAFFCPTPSCEVAYFDPFDRCALVQDLSQPVWPKDRDAPICACFGLTEDDIEADLNENGVARIRATIERAKSPDARCESLSPSGHPCIAEAQRYYLRRKAQRE